MKVRNCSLFIRKEATFHNLCSISICGGREPQIQSGYFWFKPANLSYQTRYRTPNETGRGGDRNRILCISDQPTGGRINTKYEVERNEGEQIQRKRDDDGWLLEL